MSHINAFFERCNNFRRPYRVRLEKDYRVKNYPRIVCEDGFSMSVQASMWSYCEPRQNTGPWISAECGFPSEAEILLHDWAEDPDNPRETVYGNVPIEVIDAVIEKHGGIDYAAVALDILRLS